MPILAQQPAAYPPTLFASSTDFELAEQMSGERESPRSWWVVYTLSRREKSLARKLYAAQVPYYLPLVQHEHIYRGRRVSSYVPSFSNYMFLFGGEEERATALVTNCVSRLLPVADAATLFRDLHHLHQFITSGAPVALEERLQPGRAVRIKSGSLKGVEGVIIERRGECRLLVAINYLQQGVSMAIDDYMVEAI